MIRKLYFIGNGFDLHHGIQSRYTDYAYWLIDNDLSLFYKIESAFGWPSDDWWGDFENNIGEISVEDYTREICWEYAPNYASDDFHERDRFAGQFEIERQLSELFKSIRKSFHSWISELAPANDSKKIKIDTKDSFFVNFNYTPTLENLYGVDEKSILYIHGKANKDKELILGHGKSIEQINREINSVANQTDEDQDGDDFYDMALGTTIEILGKQQKKVKEIISNNERVFASFSNIQDFYIYGLSFSSIDIPYIGRILNGSVGEYINFHISYYKNEDLQKVKTCLKNMHINDSHVEFIKRNDLLLKDK